MIAAARARLRALELTTRPVHPDTAAALERRWEELPVHVKTASQVLGHHSAGCEGTHGVFPRCDLACTPCYHSRDANRVRIDGDHTLAEVDAQMAYLRSQRGTGQHAQLIGGEVTLLSPDEHAAALMAMRRHGRKPMSMSHGDFDYDYLRALAVDADDGAPRFTHLSFAGHFDSMMYGRRGIRRVERERDLNPHRERFCAMFERLEAEYGITHYLAHNMTVTERNVDEIATVIGDCRDMGFRMFSFQPAAFVGNERRWKDDYAALSGDDVWARIEAGAGGRLAWKAFQMGDERCNRTAYGGYVADRYVQLLDDRDPVECAARDTFYDVLGGADFEQPPAIVGAKVARALSARPDALVPAARFAGRFLRRAGAIPLARHGFRPITYVMHSFMDARDVRPAWALLQRGEMSDDPRIRATQERLQACSYAMAHPESDELVPACAQHSVLDPLENLRLMDLLPMAPAGAAAG